MLGDLNERAISLKEVGEAVNEMKSDTATALDGFPVECLKKSGMAVLEWLVRLLNLSFDMGVVPMDWCGACVYDVRVDPTNFSVLVSSSSALDLRIVESLHILKTRPPLNNQLSSHPLSIVNS